MLCIIYRCKIRCQTIEGAEVEIAVKTTTNAMEIFAGAGVMMETDIQRYFKDARQFTFAQVSNGMARNFIGELMGLPRLF